MTANEWEKKLKSEGFGNFFIGNDGPGAYYPEHTHDETTAHVILSGEMTLTVQSETRTYKAGERCDVPARAVHSARMGPQGCRYIVGEK
ncbi:MAG TPA: cupin domain-containing protein [Terriglobia bacterium]|nr:cupin domain-containing protein [Terriglobia bacterium]